ncbi:DUF1501 domain-containing protein [Paraliomyxa miuraensis]|uniref:DUF1501 domain-containing protein n=1 Tax=Paraliomyxa miuraensis TaxID=376150 RepID=UPI00224C8562|nr:DUF1501 domain-containing protein [Paraliomyxa miuraensis]MCX4239200.1 DUF1501 domain-containing protein [Paraliomyxa miuraensis]
MTHRHHHRLDARFGRRSFLQGLGASAFLLPFAGAGWADQEEPRPAQRYVGLYCNGAWDVLLGPDPRDPAKSYTGIDLGTNALASAHREPIPVMMAGEEVLWGPTMASLVPHADVLTLFRGVNMNTVAHAAGRAYVNTFLPPSGVVPKGDSMGTRMAAAGDYDDLILPNVSVGMPTFNQSFPADVTGVRLSLATEMRDLLQPLSDAPLSDETLAALRAAQDEVEGCVHDQYGTRPVDELRIARDRMRQLLSDGYTSAFDLAADSELITRYGITNPNAATAPSVVAATVWRLLETGLSRTVTAQLQAGFDTHGPEWATLQPARQVAAFDALAALLTDLRQDDPQLQDTTVVVFSEFARTPKINGRGGRDHHFASSVLVFGGGLRRGVCGATLEETLGLVAIDPITGRPDPAGKVLLPEDIGATIAAAAGLPTTPFRVEPLDAWIA